MIQPEKVQNALRAMNHVLVHIRQMAYDGSAHATIAAALDIAEYLPRLVADERDQTAAYRDCLVDLASRWVQFGTAVEFFDDLAVTWPW